MACPKLDNVSLLRYLAYHFGTRKKGR